MNLEADLIGIVNLMRTHIEIRNRSFMKRVHRDCFIGSDAVDFLVTQGFADSRKQAVEIGQKMVIHSLIRHVTGKRKKFQDAYLYYRFAEDDYQSACLSPDHAGNGSGTYLGQGGCKFSFCPHTVHNSYVLDIALAEEIERAVAGASIESRARAIEKLRARVKEQALDDAPDWILVQSTEVNKVPISIYQRKRPRGDFNNVKMTGIVGESPKGFIRGIMSLETRKQWESMYEDGFIVEAIDIGEKYSPIFAEEGDETILAPTTGIPLHSKPNHPNIVTSKPGDKSSNRSSPITTHRSSPVTVIGNTTSNSPTNLQNPVLSESIKPVTNLARKTDDVLSFLQTVDLAGIPSGMPIAFLNDPERQHALAHLRKQMMLSNPQECMLCQESFDSAGDIRFCPCCAMVSCGSCVSKRVFEVVSRQVVSVCIHCYRSSSRIRHPPQAVQDNTGIDESVRGKWWRPEELGIIDYSQFVLSEPIDSKPLLSSGLLLEEIEIEDSTTVATSMNHSQSMSNTIPTVESNHHLSQETSIHSSDTLTQNNTTMENLEEDVPMTINTVAVGTVNDDENNDELDVDLEGSGDGVGLGVNESEYVQTTPSLPIKSDPNITTTTTTTTTTTNLNPTTTNLTTTATIENPASSTPQNIAATLVATTKTAKCKSCGAMISRDIEAIEEHMSECYGSSIKGRLSSLAFDGNSLRETVHIYDKSYAISNPTVLSKQQQSDLQYSGTRILYRTARKQSSKVYAPREVCVFQDSFIDKSDGICYVYEVSVRHCDVRGMSGYVTADVMLLMYVATPIPNNKNSCSITIISQVDTRVKGSQWLLSFITEDSSITGIGNDIGILRRDDLIRELKACGNLQNILDNGENNTEDPNTNIDEGVKVSLEDFDLLAVLGRGGFGKVMQVRHRPTGNVYAMKVLKKTELRRRRQVERTHTEKSILAAIRHPFIVCLHYAFQNPQKLYMVMDFVQGGDFFTLMRKFRRLPEDWVRIYVCEIGMALQHLHDMDVVYRDLKPENILLDHEGHIKLTDFGLSRFFETRPPATEDIVGEDQDVVTRSFCGTEQYMSPEMLLQQGHNHRMDWWCLGLLMHEMISARHPFQGPSHYDTLRNMVTKSPNIDARLSPAATTVVKGFLIKNPKGRLCCKEGLNELKSDSGTPMNPCKIFFQSIDWDALYNRRIDMPYKPDLKGDLDISSFETTFTREAPIDSIPEIQDTANSKNNKAIGGKGRGIMNFFGIGTNGNNAMNGNNGINGIGENANEPDVFKGFSFTKDEDKIDGNEKDSHNTNVE